MDADLEWMNLAFEEAKLALNHDDVPIGAVVVKDGVLLGRGHNRREELGLPSAHAEIQALEDAGRNHGHWNLTGAKIYITLEPCPMCAGAIQQARIEEVIYAAKDSKGGAISLEISILNNPKLNHQVSSRQGPMEQEAGNLLKEFFQRKRTQKKTSGKKI
jgi:tRNA(adenine34) deaminase